MNKQTLVLVIPAHMGTVCSNLINGMKKKKGGGEEEGTYAPSTREPYTGTNPRSPM